MKTLLIGLILISSIASAKGTHSTSESIDVDGNEIVDVDIGTNNFHYYIDTKACICVWRGGVAITTIDCRKLSVYENLKKYLRNCQ